VGIFVLQNLFSLGGETMRCRGFEIVFGSVLVLMALAAIGLAIFRANRDAETVCRHNIMSISEMCDKWCSNHPGKNPTLLDVKEDFPNITTLRCPLGNRNYSIPDGWWSGVSSVPCPWRNEKHIVRR
jgi:hypothetical protein